MPGLLVALVSSAVTIAWQLVARRRDERKRRAEARMKAFLDLKSEAEIIASAAEFTRTHLYLNAVGQCFPALDADAAAVRPGAHGGCVRRAPEPLQPVRQ